MRAKSWNAHTADLDMSVDDMSACEKAKSESSIRMDVILGHVATWDDATEAFSLGFAYGCAWMRENIIESVEIMKNALIQN